MRRLCLEKREGKGVPDIGKSMCKGLEGRGTVAGREEPWDFSEEGLSEVVEVLDCKGLGGQQPCLTLQRLKGQNLAHLPGNGGVST